jgi:hypothetical protein
MGKLGDSRVMWLRVAVSQFVLQRYTKSKAQLEAEAELGEELEAPPDDPEYGPTYLLVIPRQGARPVKLNMTALTEEELKLTRHFFNELFDLVEPIVRYRDKVANDAFAEGDDSYARIYRQVPQFIVRSGSLREDDQRILDGSQDIPTGTGGDDTADGGVRGVRDELAPGEPDEGGSKDLGPAVD